MMKETRERGRRGEWVHGWVRTKLQMIVYWSWSWSYHHDGSRPDPLTYYWDVRTNVHNFNRQMAASRWPQNLGHSIRRFLECFWFPPYWRSNWKRRKKKRSWSILMPCCYRLSIPLYNCYWNELSTWDIGDLGEPTHTLIPCCVRKPLPSRNESRGCFAPTVYRLGISDV